ncbi:MAG TPA: hypothetical protein VK620_02775, partial [Bradyrhizobium sp.]|nr:hypothetical protein [Bradyrhizobium sp.]
GGGGILASLYSRLQDELQPNARGYAGGNPFPGGMLPAMPPDAQGSAAPGAAPQGAPATGNLPQAPGQLAPASPGIGDRLGAGLLSWANTPQGNFFGGLGNLVQGLATGRRVDTQGMQQQQQQDIFHYLVKAGTPPEQAVIIAQSPDAQKAWLTAMVQPKYQLHDIKDAIGNTSPVVFNQNTGGVTLPGGGAYGAGSAPGTGPGMLAPGVSKFDSSLTGEDYLKQLSPEVQAAARAYINGDVMPSGNPRNQGIASFAKTVAQKYGMDVGQPVSDVTYAARRKMQTDLASSGSTTTGGIIANGKSAFEHLANLGDKMTALGNYNGYNGPLGGLAANAGNYVANTAGSSETKGKIAAINDNALKYGQEATKFYAGSGGGEGERMAAMNALKPSTASGNEQAAYLQTEKELMLGRLNQKEAQIRDVMGQDWLDRHPVRTPDLQATLGKIDAAIAKLRGGASGAGGNVTSSGVRWSIQ